VLVLNVLPEPHTALQHRSALTCLCTLPCVQRSCQKVFRSATIPCFYATGVSSPRARGGQLARTVVSQGAKMGGWAVQTNAANDSAQAYVSLHNQPLAVILASFQLTMLGVFI
jgi:hypothetical protein